MKNNWNKHKHQCGYYCTLTDLWHNTAAGSILAAKAAIQEGELALFLGRGKSNGHYTTVAFGWMYKLNGKIESVRNKEVLP